MKILFEAYLKVGTVQELFHRAERTRSAPQLHPVGLGAEGDTTLIYDCGETRDERAMISSFFSLLFFLFLCPGSALKREQFTLSYCCWTQKKNKRANSLFSPSGGEVPPPNNVAPGVSVCMWGPTRQKEWKREIQLLPHGNNGRGSRALFKLAC